MLMVIYIHSKAGNEGAVWELNYWVIIRQFFSIAVAIFFVLAGYFASESGGGWKRYEKLLIPFLMWSVLYTALNYDWDMDLGSVLMLVLSGRSSAQLYFILVLIELTFMTPLLKKALFSRNMSYLILAITPIYFCVFCYLQIHYKTGSIWWAGRDCFAWISYYYLGMIYRKGGICLKKNLSIEISIIGLLLCFVEGFWFAYGMGNPVLATGQLKLSTYILAIGVAGLMFCYAEVIRFPEWLVSIGDNSYGIYYLHTFVLMCENFMAKRIAGINMIPLPLFHFLQVSSTVILCSFIISFAKKVIKSKKILLWVGLV